MPVGAGLDGRQIEDDCEYERPQITKLGRLLGTHQRERESGARAGAGHSKNITPVRRAKVKCKDTDAHKITRRTVPAAGASSYAGAGAGRRRPARAPHRARRRGRLKPRLRGRRRLARDLLNHNNRDRLVVRRVAERRRKPHGRQGRRRAAPARRPPSHHPSSPRAATAAPLMPGWRSSPIRRFA